MLQRNGANVLGCVLTKVDKSTRSYYSYYGNEEIGVLLYEKGKVL